MEINLLTASNMPEGAIVSMRTGSNVRQAPASSGRSFVFPAQTTDQPLKVQVLKPIGTAYVAFKPGEDQYKVTFPCFEGLEMACEVQVRTSDDGIVVPKKAAAATTSVKDARNYLESHQVVPFLQASLEALIQERPEDPYAYLGRHFCSGYCPSDLRTGVAPTTSDATGNVDIKASAGTADAPAANDAAGNVDIKPSAEDAQKNLHQDLQSASDTGDVEKVLKVQSGDVEVLSLSLNLRPGTAAVTANGTQRPEAQTLKPGDLPGRPQDHLPTGEKGPASNSARVEPPPQALQPPAAPEASTLKPQGLPGKPQDQLPTGEKGLASDDARPEPRSRALQPPAPAQPVTQTSPPPKTKQAGEDAMKDCLCCNTERPMPTAEEEEAASVIQRSIRSKRGWLETRGEASWPEELKKETCMCCPADVACAKAVDREPFGAPAPPGLEGKDVPRPLVSPWSPAPGQKLPANSEG